MTGQDMTTAEITNVYLRHAMHALALYQQRNVSDVAGQVEDVQQAVKELVSAIGALSSAVEQLERLSPRVEP